MTSDFEHPMKGIKGYKGSAWSDIADGELQSNDLETLFRWPQETPWCAIYPSEELLNELTRLVSTEGMRSAYYRGLADEKIVKALSTSSLESLTVWDQLDYWGISDQFFADEDDDEEAIADNSVYRFPDWLLRVRFQVEGGSRNSVDLYILDLLHMRDDDIQRLLRQIDAKVLVLAGKAVNFRDEAKYRWRALGEVWIGTRPLSDAPKT